MSVHACMTMPCPVCSAGRTAAVNYHLAPAPEAAPTPERGDVSSEPTAEGLTEAERHVGTVMGIAMGQPGRWYSEADVVSIIANHLAAQAERTCRECALVGYHCGSCGCCVPEQADAHLLASQCDADDLRSRLYLATSRAESAEAEADEAYGHGYDDGFRACSDDLQSAVAERDDLRAALDRVKAAVDCPHGPRHYYAVDATCQRCEMPSWVEVLLRAAVEGGRS